MIRVRPSSRMYISLFASHGVTGKMQNKSEVYPGQNQELQEVRHRLPNQTEGADIYPKKSTPGIWKSGSVHNGSRKVCIFVLMNGGQLIIAFLSISNTGFCLRGTDLFRP